MRVGGGGSGRDSETLWEWDRMDGWEGLVMIYTPSTRQELDVVFQLITESYNHVTGLDIQASGC